MTISNHAANTRRPVRHLGTDDLQPVCGSTDTTAETVYSIPTVSCADCLRIGGRSRAEAVQRIAIATEALVAAVAHTPELEAAYHAQADRHAAIMWLRNAPRTSSARARRALAHRLMVASVYLQAGLLGVVNCSRCGDRGCDWCSPLRRRVGA